MTRTFDQYRHDYRHVAMTRRDGIVELRLHTNGGPLVWGAGPHAELGHCFREVGSDRTNRLVILTGTGPDFLCRLDESWVGPMTAARWERIYTDGKRLLQGLVDIEVPVIAALRGRATVHAELGLLADIVVAGRSTVFQDAPHFPYGTVPGDGVHLVWPHLLGPNRGRYFLLTGQRIDAARAHDLGVVAEVVDDDAVLERAWELARLVARQPDVTLRLTREAFAEPLRRLLASGLGHGLALEGLAAFETWPTGQ